MDKETTRKAQDVLARRGVEQNQDPLRLLMGAPYPIIPSHFVPPAGPSVTRPMDQIPPEGAGKTTIKGQEDKKNKQAPNSDAATRGSVKDGDEQGDAPKVTRRNFRDEFAKNLKELRSMSEEERDAMFPHRKYISRKGCSADVAFQFLMDDVGSI